MKNSLQATQSGGRNSTVFATNTDNTGMLPQDSVAFEQFKSATNTTDIPYAIRKQSLWDWLIHKHSGTRTFSMEGHTAGTGSNAIASYRDDAGNKYHILIKDIPADSLTSMRKVVQNTRVPADAGARHTAYAGSSGRDDCWDILCGCMELMGCMCELARLILKCVIVCR